MLQSDRLVDDFVHCARKHVVVVGSTGHTVFVLLSCLRSKLRQGIRLLVFTELQGLVGAAVLMTAGRHIPYRDSKLTRMLQDSLGGNSYTDSWL